MAAQYGTTLFSVIPTGVHNRVAVDSSITLTAPVGAEILEFQAETTAGNFVRLTLDGTTPTATLGFMFDTALGVQRLDLYEGVATVKFIGSAIGQFVNFQWYMAR